MTTLGYKVILGKRNTYDCISTFLCNSGKHSRTNENKILTVVDKETIYKHLKKTKLKLWELDHDIFVIKMKIALQNALQKIVVRGDIADETTTYIDAKNRFVRKAFCDLMVATDDEKKYVGIEYEKNLKNKYSYIGRTIKDKIGRAKQIKGYFELRQEDPYMKACFLVCETKGIIKKLIEYLKEASLVQDDGRVLKLDKFFLMEKSKNQAACDLISEGKVVQFTMSNKRSLDNPEWIDFKEFILTLM